MTITPEAPTTPLIPRRLELEITNRCQLTCPTLCFVKAGPTRGHGTMTVQLWKRVISEAAVLGVQKIQLIGGEATLHPGFVEIVEHALGEGLTAEVFSNLFRIRRDHWTLFERPGVSLATSYHADTDKGHDEVTGRAGSHTATRENIIEALRRGIRIRVGIVDVLDGQRVEEARAELLALGVTQVHVDRVRAVGNAGKGGGLPSTSELCGRCATGTAAVLADGTVTPCVIGRFLPGGQVQDATLERVFTSPQWQQIAARIPAAHADPCGPDCGPNDDSQGGGGTCGPADDGVFPGTAD